MAGRILVPLDGTKYAEQVVPLVAEIAARSEMPVSLVSVIDPGDLNVTETAGEGVPVPSDYSTAGDAGMNMAQEGFGGITGMVWMSGAGSPKDLSEDEAKALDEATRQMRGYLFSVQRRLADKGIETQSNLAFGNADDEIVGEAARAGASMIAMTGRSKSFWERGALGSTADRVVNGSPMPVLVFKPMEGLAEAVSVVPETIVIGLDGSGAAEQGLKPAIDLAKAVGAKVALVQIVKNVSASKRQEVEKYLSDVASKMGIDAGTYVRSGQPAEELILCADEFSHPLIAVTEHGGRSFGRWFRGSTTDKVIRNAGYPVLVSPVSKS